MERGDGGTAAVRVLVSGATGFIGERLIASLVADRYRARALVHPEGDPAPLARLGVETIVGDVRDPAAVRRAVDGCEIVYHLAGLVPGQGRTPEDFRAVNVQGTANVVRAAIEGRVRHLVHCSSVSVHGVPRTTPANEDAPLAPLNVYGATKLGGERAVQRGVREHGLSALIVRPTALYGPGDVRGAKLFRDVARQRLVMIGRGRVRCHLAYVDDVVAALRLCGARAEARGECFIVGGAERPTVDELLRLIAAEAGVAPRALRLPAWPAVVAARLWRGLVDPETAMPGLVDRCDFFTADRTYDVTRAERELGFRPRVRLREGIRRTVQWYRVNGML